jgi:hypothetical protein
MIYLVTDTETSSGTALGLAGTSRLLFGAVAIAMFSNITNNKYASVIARHVREAVSEFNIPSANMAKLTAAARLNTAAAWATVPDLTPEIRAAASLANKEAYLEGAHLSYLVALAFGCVACIAAFFIRDIDDRKWTKKTVAVQETDRKAMEEKKLQQLE